MILRCSGPAANRRDSRCPAELMIGELRDDPGGDALGATVRAAGWHFEDRVYAWAPERPEHVVYCPAHWETSAE